MARRATRPTSSVTILLVEDDLEYAETTRLLLMREGHAVVVAHTGSEALNLLRQREFDLVLLDYVMPGMTGEETVKQLRTFNDYVQVILQTGHATANPPRSLLQRLDIQGYHDKSEGPEKLLLWVDIGLKAAFAKNLLRKSRHGLRYILSVTPDLHKIQPLVDLLQGVLLQIMGLIGASNSFLAVIPQVVDRNPEATAVPHEVTSFLAMPEETELVIRASTGRFAGVDNAASCLDPSTFELVSAALQQPEMRVVNGKTIVPLCVGPLVIGVVYLDHAVDQDGDRDLLRIYGNQAAAAIHSSQLLEMATVDPLTGTHLRRFFEQWVARELRSAFRLQQQIGMMLVDLDGLKRLNDEGGHLVGDRALALVGRVLKQVLRESDIAGRFGGDEFAVLLPQADIQGAERVAKRILDALKDASVPGDQNEFPVRACIGVAALKPHSFPSASIPRPMPVGYFHGMMRHLIQHADSALYAAKREGSACVTNAVPCEWLTP